MRRKKEEDVTGKKSIDSGSVLDTAAHEVRVQKESRTHAADDGRIEMESVRRSMFFPHRQTKKKKRLLVLPLRLALDMEERSRDIPLIRIHEMIMKIEKRRY